MTFPEISPEMKVSSLLDHYPEVENALAEMAPEFKKLKNPFLRKTIARVTSLKQAATIAGIPAETLVNRLRMMVGLPALEGYVSELEDFEGPQPGWLKSQVPVKTFDASEIIHSGGMPLGQIMADLEMLSPGEVYLLVTPMLPVPLLEKAREKAFRSWSEKTREYQYHNWFLR